MDHISDKDFDKANCTNTFRTEEDRVVVYRVIAAFSTLSATTPTYIYRGTNLK